MKRNYALVLLVMFSSLSFLILPQYHENTASISAASDRSLRVALTFDDGPSPDTTEALLDGLKERNVHATFFLIGEQISAQESTVKRMKAEGHQIGNHSYSHIRLDRASDGGLSELQKTDELLTALLGDDSYWIRPPWGFAGKAVKQSADVPLIYWSVDTTDWQSHNPDLIVRCILDNVQDGDIILLHDIYPESVNAALRAIDALTASGFTFLTVEELFAEMKITPQTGQLYARPDTLVTW